MRERADIREIARRARVSISTVSRVTNFNPTVRVALARRVWREADKCGYFPNSHARSLASGKSKLLGVVVSDITDPFSTALVDAFETHAVQQGYEILIASVSGDVKRTRTAIRRMIERRVAGIAVLTFGLEDRDFATLRGSGPPMVCLEGMDAGDVTANIRIDYLKGIREAVQHLAALRHVRIAFVAGPAAERSATGRRVAFETSMRELELPVGPESVRTGDHTPESGRKIFGKLMNFAHPPTAIICSNDLTAIGALQEARRRGISIPGDLSIVGIENSWVSPVMIPALTTVNLPQNEIARCAFSALTCTPQEKKTWAGHMYEVPTELIIRESTALSKESVRGRRD